MAARVAVSEGRREGRRRRCRAQSRRFRESQYRSRLFQKCDAGRDRRSAAKCGADLRLDHHQAGGSAGAGWLALVAGHHVRDARRDRLPRMANVRRPAECSRAYKQAMSQPGVDSSETRNRQIENAIFLIPFATYAYFYQASDQTIPCRCYPSRSILENTALWTNLFSASNTSHI